jgi:site-specific DNA-cytosine methylase
MNDHIKTFRHAHLACGIGAGARGFNMANPRIGNVRARFECAGGIDVDAGAIANFEKLTGAKGTVMDLFSTEQYIDFHGKVPPADWREASPADVHQAFGPNLDVCFASMPCKGFSGLLSQKQSETQRYQALNGLTLRGIWLLLEAYKDDPIPIVLFENVPRIANRGRWLLDQIIALFRHYGYAVAETVHDCGELGGLAQSRKRFLLIARHQVKVPPFVYQPPKRRLRGVGEVIGKLPLPGDLIAGPMHRVPALQWQTWVRLAFVPAGKDWRALNELEVEGGMLKDFGIVPEIPLRENALGVCGWDDSAPLVTGARSPGQGRFSVADPRPHGRGEQYQGSYLGVNGWDESVGAVSTRGGPTNGAYSVADPRVDGYPHHGTHGVRGWEAPAGVVGAASRPANGPHAVADPRVHNGHPKSVQLGVRSWGETSPCVKGDMSVGTGPYSVADPRLRDRTPHNNVFRIVPFDGPAKAVTGAHGSGQCVADPRMPPADYSKRKYKVTPYDGPSRAVIGASTTGDGAFAVADPRCTWGADSHRNKLRVTSYEEPAGTVAGINRVGSGAPCVADPREAQLCNESVPLILPAAKDRLVCRIVSLDDTWHRPFTTLELAALQSIVDPEEAFEEIEGVWCAREGFDLTSTSDATKREWIGNAVPSAASAAMATTIGETLLLAGMGETFTLSTREIWVKPLALALAVDTDQVALRMDGGLC